MGTLVSGAYISVDVGHSSVPAHSFTGLEVPPIVTSGLPGREYVLHAKDIGSLSIGSTVFYRHVAAGQVVAYSLDPSGDSVTIKVFINSPYDQFVTHDTRFWQASGIDMSIDSEESSCIPNRSPPFCKAASHSNRSRARHHRRNRPWTQASRSIRTRSAPCASRIPWRKPS